MPEMRPDMPVHKWVKARRKSDGKILSAKLPRSIVQSSKLLTEVPSTRPKPADKQEKQAEKPETKEVKK